MVIRRKYGAYGISAGEVLPIVTDWLKPPPIQPHMLSTSHAVEAGYLPPGLAIIGGLVAIAGMAFIASKVLK